MNKQLGWAALVLCGLSLMLITALTALHDVVPDVLNLIAIGALTGGASLAVPGGGTTDTSYRASAPASSPAPARSSSPAPVAAARVPAQASAPSSNGSVTL